MTASVTDSMGKYLQKQLTIYVSQRASTQIAWGDAPIFAVSGLRYAGNNNLISGDVTVNGPVTVDNKVSGNFIDGTLTCPSLSNSGGGLTYNNLVNASCASCAMLNLGVPQQYFQTNLSTSVNVFNDTIHEYVFAGTGNQNLASVQNVWQGNNSASGILKQGMYYCQGKIILNSNSGVSGRVTFVANQIDIHNTASGGSSSYDDVISLTPYYEDLLFWANGSQGTLNGLGNADIEIEGNGNPNNNNGPCAALEGVTYAPNGEVELSGSRALYNDVITNVIFRATLDKGALIAKYVTISGDYWDIYRW